MSFDANRYAINFIHQCLMKVGVKPPDRERSGDNYDALNALHEAYLKAGNEGAQTAWKVLRRAVPHLDKPIKLINFNDLHLLSSPDYALPTSHDGQAPNYAIYLKGLNILYGMPGSGKSFVAIDFAKRLSLAYSRKAVVYSAGEGKHGLYGRSAAWTKHFQAETENLYLWDEAIPLLNPEAVQEFIETVRPLNPVFIIVDTLARAMLGENENDTAVMGRFIQSAEMVMRELDCGMLLVHHTNRQGYLRGSIALDGGADSILKIQRNEEEIIIYNSLEKGGKNKHTDELPAIYMRLLPVEVIWDDHTIHNEAVIVQADKIMDKIESDLSDNQLQILLTLEDVENLSVAALLDASGISKATFYRNLKKLLKAGLIHLPSPEHYALTSTGKDALL